MPMVAHLSGSQNQLADHLTGFSQQPQVVTEEQQSEVHFHRMGHSFHRPLYNEGQHKMSVLFPSEAQSRVPN